MKIFCWLLGLVAVLLFITKVTCIPDNGTLPYLLWTDRHRIRSLQIDTWRSQIVIRNLTNAVGVDFDYHDGYLFWTDPSDDQIFRATKPVNGQASEKIAIVSDDIKNLDGIAVDWLYNHVYWVDAGVNQIAVADYDGKMRRSLVTEGLDKPRAIVVDPLQGWMFWTDWGDNPMISRCGLNGKHQSVIVDEGLGWPNGLTFDYVDQRLFWIDAKFDEIRSVDTNGGSGYRVLGDTERIAHPFAITLFEDDLYWTDWKNYGIYRVNKLRGDEFKQVANSVQSPMGIRVYHENVQQRGTNRCGTNNGRCSEFCFPSPQGSSVPNDTDKTNGFTCGCRNLYQLDSDQRTCVPETASRVIESILL